MISGLRKDSQTTELGCGLIKGSVALLMQGAVGSPSERIDVVEEPLDQVASPEVTEVRRGIFRVERRHFVSLGQGSVDDSPTMPA
jgi:hypothetical protein